MKSSNDNNRARLLKESRKKLLIPRVGYWKCLATVGVFLLIFLAIYFTHSDLQLLDKIWVHTSFITLSLVLFEFYPRLFIAIEEYDYIETRYENSWKLFFEYFLHLSVSLKVLLVLCFISNIVVLMKLEQRPWSLWYSFGETSTLFSLGGLLFGRIFKFHGGPLHESLWISDSNGLDSGSAMAHSFFHGYLNLIIPKTGSKEPHLKELMENYEAREHVSLKCYKIFILIPKSLYCPPSLMDNITSPSIEESKSLVEKQLDVAGVKDRSYKNSIYKIKTVDGKKVFVAAEYATPLRTFKNAFEHNGEYSANYERHKNEIVLRFYKTLQKILREHPHCDEYCELIYYDDIKAIKNGKYYYNDVGQIILERLKEIKKEQKKMGHSLKIKQS